MYVTVWLRVCECVCVRPEGLNDHFKPPLSLLRPVHSILLDVWLFFGSIYWGDLLCRVQCLCETVSVYVQGRDDGHRNPGSLTVPCVCERVYLLWSLLLRSVYARCCAVSLGHHSFIFFIYFFCGVYRCEHEENWKLLAGDSTYLSLSGSPLR